LTISEREVVAALGQAIAQRIGEPRYNLWFVRHTKFTWDEAQLLVGVPNHFFQEWLEDTYGTAVREAAQQVFDRPLSVRFAIDPELFQAARQAQAEAAAQKPKNQTEGNPTRPPERDDPPPIRGRSTVRPPRRWHRLEEFVVGPCNRVAHASAQNVVEAPGQGTNPLVLHGPVGTGKTHLLEGIYAGLHRAHPEWHVQYVTAEEFTNRFVQSLRLGKLAAFRKHFRDCDVLLVDDLHFLARKRATREEFLHTFDALLANGCQLVLTCDGHPRLADDFSPELIDRLVGGAVWSLSPPDAATRLAILRSKAAGGEVPVPEPVLRYLADHLCGNVRELLGALHSVRHYSRVAGRPIDIALAREALGELLRQAVRVVRLADVDEAVCRVLRLEAGALQAKQRAWAVSHPRMVAMFLARKHTTAAYSEIGRHFGGRNHSTAVAAEKKIRGWLADDGELVLGERRIRLREVIELVERELQR
jgi:chromosomal replication initiator protein